MSKKTAPFNPGVTVDNNPKTGLIDFKFNHPTEGTAVMGLPPLSALFLVNVAIARLMQRNEPEIIEGLQTFAISTVEADKLADGTPYLKYFMENGLGFATGLSHEALTTLYHQLGDLLGWPIPKAHGEVPH